MAEGPNSTDIPHADFSSLQVTEKPSVLAAQNRPPNPSRFRFERVNEFTWKLTNGEQTNVPASRGQWGGYRKTKALAWVICIVSGKWLARCSEMVCGPSSLKRAKAAAMAMVKGAAGDYQVTNAVTHLNGLTARLSDRFSDGD